VADATVVEGNDPANNNTADFVITLGGKQANPVTLTYHTVEGTDSAVDGTLGAKKGSDYTDTTGQVTIDAGQTTATIHVPVIGNTLASSNKTFSFVVDTPSGATPLKTTATGTILDDDSATGGFTVGNAQVVEGNSGNTNTADFVITLGAVQDHAVTLAYHTGDGTATTANGDYTPTTGLITIPAGQTTATVHVPVHGDTTVSANKTFSLKVDGPNGNSATSITAAGTILNDDALEGTTVSVADAAPLVEGNSGTKDAKFTISLNQKQDKDVWVHYSTADGTAKSGDNGSDYVFKSGDVLIKAGDLTADVLVSINGDTVASADKTFTLNLSPLGNAGMTDSIATGTIQNDDVSTLTSFSVDDVKQVEGNSGESNFDFVVTLGKAQDYPVTLHYSTADGTAVKGTDYTETTGFITIPAHSTSAVVHVPVKGDTTVSPDKTFTLSVDAPGGSDPANTHATATGTILNDDVKTGATVNINDVTLLEGNSGTTYAKFTISLSGVINQDQPFWVHYSTANGSAVAGTDYTAMSGDIPFAANQTSAEILVPILGNTTASANKTFTLNLSPLGNATMADASATGTILNDDVSSGTSLSVDDASKAEGDLNGTNTVDFTVKLGTTQSYPVSIPYHTAADGTAGAGDFTAKSGYITIAAGQTQGTVSVPIMGDTTLEPNETFSLNLEHVGGALFSKQSATGTILNDDAPGLSVSNIQVTEGDSDTKNANFTITLDNPSTNAITVHFKTSNGTAIAGTDYVAVDTTFTIPAGQTSFQVPVQIKGNTTASDNKTFSVILETPTNATITQSTATGTILNDDVAPGSLSISADHTQFSFHDVDGDLVTVKSSKALFTTETSVLSAFHFHASATNSQWFQLEGVDFTQLSASLQRGSDLTFSVQQANGGDGLVNVGYIKSSRDLGTIIVPGDLGQITVGDGTASTPALKLLDVGSIGALGTSTGATSLLSTFMGPVGTLHVDSGFGSGLNTTTGNVLNAHLDFVNATKAGTGSIKTLLIDGALIGGSDARSGEITFTGKLTSASIGNIQGGSGAGSGSILDSSSSASIGSIKVAQGIAGGYGGGSGSISAPSISSVWIGSGGLVGGSGNSSGVVEASSLGTIYVDGSVMGGHYADSTHAGLNSGQISVGSIKSAIVMGDLVGGSGLSSGVIMSSGAIPFVKVDGSIIGGTAGLATVAFDPALNIPAQTGQLGYSGAIIASKLGTVIVGTSIVGGDHVSDSLTGTGSGAVVSATSIDSVTIGKDAQGVSILGKSAETSGFIKAGTSFGKITLAGSVQGGSAKNSGGIIGLSSSGSLQIGGSLVGGAGVSSGQIYVPQGVNSVKIGENIEGGSGAASGHIDAPNGLNSVRVNGNVHGGTGNSSGQIYAPLGIKSVVIGGLIGNTGPHSGTIEAIGTSSTGIGTLQIKGNVTGNTGAGSGSVAGELLGSVTIGGDVQGGAGANSGEIFSNSTINSISVVGSLSGGDGNLSGSIVTNRGRISTATIGGDIHGGDGNSSGFLNSDSLGTVVVTGSVVGGAGTSSGAIHSDVTGIASLTINSVATLLTDNFHLGVQGLIGGDGADSGTVAGVGLSKAKIVGDIQGGKGARSGSISVLGGDIKGLTLNGPNGLVGGTGDGSGSIITDGVLSGVTISKDIVGGDASAGTIRETGYIQARQIANLTVGGHLRAGTADPGAHLFDSGAIRATQNILSLTIVGDLLGSDTNNAIISAVGPASLPDQNPVTAAIKSLTIKGNVDKAEILGGYGLVGANGTDPRGVALNSDARIGTVTVGGNWSASSLVAGVIAGADGKFGTPIDDAPIQRAGTSNNPDLFSTISSLIVKGSAIPPTGNAGNYGIVAQNVVTVKFGGVSVPITQGPSNDSAGVVVNTGANLAVLEVAAF
jgi:hypothetical protein